MNTNRTVNTVNANRVLIAVALFATATCSRQSLLKGQPYVQELQQRLTNVYGYFAFPVGRIQIMSNMSSQMEAIDWTNHKFPISYVVLLQRAQKDGLLNLTEEQQGPLDSIRNMGARFFTVTPSEKLLKMKLYNGAVNAIAASVLIATFDNLKVVKDDEYKPPAGFGGAGDEFRLVLGTVRQRPTPDAITLGKSYCTTEVQELKFRAVLEFDPIAKTTFSLRGVDLGNPQGPGWNTENVK